MLELMTFSSYMLSKRSVTETAQTHTHTWNISFTVEIYMYDLFVHMILFYWKEMEKTEKGFETLNYRLKIKFRKLVHSTKLYYSTIMFLYKIAIRADIKKKAVIYIKTFWKKWNHEKLNFCTQPYPFAESPCFVEGKHMFDVYRN